MQKRLISIVRWTAMILAFGCIVTPIIYYNSGQLGNILGGLGILFLALSMVAGVFSPGEKHLYSKPTKNWILVMSSIGAFFTIAALILSQM